MHRPDHDTPIEETLSALDDLITQGKVRYIGNSNFAGWQIADADWIARSGHLNRFVSAQNNYSLLERGVEAEVNPACERFGLGLLPYLPAGLGPAHRQIPARRPAAERHPAGRPAAAHHRPKFDQLEALTALGRRHGLMILLDLAFGGLAAHPAVLGDRRGHLGGPGQGQGRGRGLDTLRRRTPPPGPGSAAARRAGCGRTPPPPPAPRPARRTPPLAGRRHPAPPWTEPGPRAPHGPQPREYDTAGVPALLVAADHADHRTHAGASGLTRARNGPPLVPLV